MPLLKDASQLTVDQRKAEAGSPLRRWSARIAVLLVILVAAASFGVGTYVFDAAILRKPPPTDHPAADASRSTKILAKSRIEGAAWMAATPHERWTLSARDGTSLVGFYFPAVRSTKRTAVLIHGHHTNAASMASYAEIYRADGFNVFTADNRAHGASDGRYIGMGILDASDTIDWVNTVVARIGGNSEIILHGISMGGSTVVAMSSRTDLPAQVKAGIEDCGFTSVREELAHQLGRNHLPSFPFVDVASLETRLLAGYDFDEGTPIESVRRQRIPLFFIHGAVDRYTPTEMVNRLFEAASGPKDLWIVPDASHAISYFLDPRLYTARVRDFYRKYLYQEEPKL